MSLQSWEWSSSDGKLKLSVTEEQINYSTNKSLMSYKLVYVARSPAGTEIDWEIPGVDSGHYEYSLERANVQLVSDSYWTSHNSDGTATKRWSATASVRDAVSGQYTTYSVPIKALVLTPIVVPSYTLNPSLSVSYVDSFNSQVLSGRTKIKATVSNMGENYGITPSWVATLNYGGMSVSSPVVSGNGSYTFPAINYSGPVSIVVTASDSRGAASVPASSSVTYVAYQAPTLSLSGSRCDSQGNSDILGTYYIVTETHSVDTSITGNGVSALVIKANGIAINAGQVYAASIDSTVNIVASITDNVGSTVTQTIVINKGRYLFKGNTQNGLSFGVPIDVPGITINGDNIVEYGSGSNSTSAGSAGTERWFKFASGLLIKTGSITRTMGMSVWTSPIYYTADATISFNATVPFVEAPDVNISASVVSTVWGAAQDISASGFAYNFMRAGSLSSQSWTIHYTAIGRWK